jgi:hypothetical protein
MRDRRPNLATIVGSSLAAVAAGSLLAFSSLAENAGLQGLATGRIQPAAPVRGGSTRAITLPAPAPGPEEPVGPIEQLVRDAFAGSSTPVATAPAPRPRVTPGAPSVERAGRPEKREKPKPRKRPAPDEPSPAVAFVPRETAEETETQTETGEESPQGSAYGHDKKAKKPKAPKAPKHSGKEKGGKTDSGPMYAREAAEPESEPKDEGTQWGPVKDKKAKKSTADAPGRGNGHARHGHDNGKGRGKGKGHSKHGD